jgi:hypothetical protein
MVNVVLTQIRAEMGKLDLDQTFTTRSEINEVLLRELDQATDPWGVKVTRVELRDIQPSHGVQQAMEQQMTAEREKRASILRSEGDREAQVNAARGGAEALVLDAKAKQEALLLEADAQAKQTGPAGQGPGRCSHPAGRGHRGPSGGRRKPASAVGQGLDRHGRTTLQGPRRLGAAGGSPEPRCPAHGPPGSPGPKGLGIDRLGRIHQPPSNTTMAWP